jgi:cytochrome c-type biogenesis protein CcmH/NrfF
VRAQNILLLLWAVVPVIAVIVGAWFFLRAGRRWEEREKKR